jgi:hypothetical protein
MSITIKLYCLHCHSMKDAMGNKIIDAKIADISLSMSGNWRIGRSDILTLVKRMVVVAYLKNWRQADCGIGIGVFSGRRAVFQKNESSIGKYLWITSLFSPWNTSNITEIQKKKTTKLHEVAQSFLLPLWNLVILCGLFFAFRVNADTLAFRLRCNFLPVFRQLAAKVPFAEFNRVDKLPPFFSRWKSIPESTEQRILRHYEEKKTTNSTNTKFVWFVRVLLWIVMRYTEVRESPYTLLDIWTSFVFSLSAVRVTVTLG